MQPVLETRSLRFRYPDGTEAVRGVDFLLYPGETVALLGPNGSGKSTFSLLLAGLLRGQGEIYVGGARLEDATLADVRRHVGLVFQNADEQLFMPTVLEDVAFGPVNAGMAARRAFELARTTLEQVGFKAGRDRAPYHLSAGEKRRVSLAGVLVMQPDILILDEPTTSLDPPGQRDLTALLRSLPQSKVVITNDTDFARALAARAVFFSEGRIAADGDLEEILHRFAWRNSQPA